LRHKFNLRCPAPINELLFERELQGMRIHVYFKISILTYLLVSDWLMPVNRQFYLWVIYLSLILVEGLFLVWLRKKQWIKAVAFSSLLVDLFLITLLPFAWYQMGGASGAYSSTYILKTNMPLVAAGFICINAFAARPLYPILMSIGALGVATFHYYWVLSDPNTVLTIQYGEHLLGSALHSAYYWVTSYAYLVFGAGMGYMAYSFRKTTLEAVTLEKANLQLGRYFSPNLIASITDGSQSFLEPGGKRQPVAIMFIDIRGFTSMSEALPPEAVVRFLSDYHERMVRVIFKHGGTLDKFMGDGILATFGTPLTQADDLSRALKAGIEMKEALREMNQERALLGLPIIGQGIGIHYGEVIVGNIGTAERLEYTVIGDAVNQASRIESACKDLDHDFLCSASVVEGLAGEIRTRPMGEVAVKGKKQPLQLFAVDWA